MPTLTVAPPVATILEALVDAAAGAAAGAPLDAPDRAARHAAPRDGVHEAAGVAPAPSAAGRGAGDRDPVLLGASLSSWRRRTRAELGLPVDVAVIGTGHQPGFWHPGIVAKEMLAAELAAAVGGAAFHVVVEHDVDPPALLTVPVRDGDGSLRELAVDLAKDAAHAATGGPTSPIVEWMPPFEPPLDPWPRTPGAAAIRAALPDVQAGLERIVAALRARRGEPNAAMQVTRAAFDLLGAACPPLPLVRSSALLETTLGRALLERIAADPWACAAAYNRAVAATPGAATALTIRDDRVEVPLWRLDAEGRRMRAWDDDLERAAAGPATPLSAPAASIVRLRPRALMLTGFLRLAACDAFIHGTGGAVYDVAMERWLAEWLGVRVAPAAAATTTLHLPFPEATAPRLDLDRARRTLREATFDPEGVGTNQGDPPDHPGPRKREWLDAIDLAPRRSLERRTAWRTMHEELARLRAARAADLAALERAVAEARRQALARPIVESRTWPFPFFAPRVLEALRAAARAAVAEAGAAEPRGNS